MVVMIVLENIRDFAYFSKKKPKKKPSNQNESQPARQPVSMEPRASKQQLHLPSPYPCLCTNTDVPLYLYTYFFLIALYVHLIWYVCSFYLFEWCFKNISRICDVKPSPVSSLDHWSVQASLGENVHNNAQVAVMFNTLLGFELRSSWSQTSWSHVYNFFRHLNTMAMSLFFWFFSFCANVL